MAIIQLNFFSEALRSQEMLSIALPQNHDLPDGRKLPVLYLLHGYTGNHNSWMTDVPVERYATQKGVAVVMPDGANGWYTNLRRSARYFDYIADEIPGIVNKLFQVSDRPEDTYIAGFSMGGYGAVKIALTYPDRFRAAASMSGVLLLKHLEEDHRELIFGKDFKVLGTEHDNEFLLRRLKETGSRIPGLYFCCGTEDGYIHCNRDLAALCDELGVPYTFAESKGGHGGLFMDEYFPKVMDHLFP